MINIEKKMNIISILGVFLGIFTNRVLIAKYGNSGSVMIASIALIAIVVPIIYLVIKKKYKQTLVLLFMVLPGIVMWIGIYMDNMYLMGGGFISLFITIPIMVKIEPKLNNKNH